jgi:hypothetical protein
MTRRSLTLCKYSLILLVLNKTNILHRGNKIDGGKKQKKLTSSELRKKKKERMARRKRGEEVLSDEE